MTPPTFNTITSGDWLRHFANRHKVTNPLPAQIRAALAQRHRKP